MNWGQNKKIELKYKTSLRRINKKIINAVTGLKTTKEINAALNKVYKSKMFHNLADIIAKRFVTNINMADVKTWREAAKAGSKGREIHKALKKTLENTNIGREVNRQILENAKLIKTLPLDISKEVTKFVGTKAYGGIRASETAKVLEGKIFQYTHAKANLIARTETSKAMTALTEARAKDIGVKMYYWRTANDGNRVRKSHQHMKDVIVFWDDPPSPEALIGEKNVGHYHAGEIWNCRCFARPILSIDTIKFPCKVYRNGEIISMNKREFLKII